MKFLTAILLTICAVPAARESSWTQVPSAPDRCCVLVEQALEDYSRIKPGLTREEVEKLFEPEGGFQTEASTRYWYRKCHDIEVVIDFKAKPPKSGESFSPKDTVQKKSKLFIDFPTLD